MAPNWHFYFHFEKKKPIYEMKEKNENFFFLHSILIIITGCSSSSSGKIFFPQWRIVQCHIHTHKWFEHNKESLCSHVPKTNVFTLYIQIKARIHHHSVHLYIYTLYVKTFFFFLSIFIIIPESMVTVLRQKQTNKQTI